MVNQINIQNNMMNMKTVSICKHTSTRLDSNYKKIRDKWVNKEEDSQNPEKGVKDKRIVMIKDILGKTDIKEKQNKNN